jgi:hypothetical protein
MPDLKPWAIPTPRISGFRSAVCGNPYPPGKSRECSSELHTDHAAESISMGPFFSTPQIIMMTDAPQGRLLYFGIGTSYVKSIFTGPRCC